MFISACFLLLILVSKKMRDEVKFGDDHSQILLEFSVHRMIDSYIVLCNLDAENTFDTKERCSSLI